MKWFHKARRIHNHTGTNIYCTPLPGTSATFNTIPLQTSVAHSQLVIIEYTTIHIISSTAIPMASSTTTTTTVRCISCGKSTSTDRRCAVCKSNYCSQACQKEDWPSHKLFCKSFPDFANRPNPDARRAIFFPVEDQPPRFVWLKTEWKIDEDDGIRWHSAHYKEFIGPGLWNTVWVQNNGMRGRTRTDALNALVREAAIPEGCPLNKAVIQAAGKRFIHFAWRGPILVTKKEGLGMTGDPEHLDVDMADVGDTLDVLCSYSNININFAKPMKTWKLQGVRVNCPGEVELYGRPEFEQAVIPDEWREGWASTTPGFKGRNPVTAISPISQKIGLPVRIFPCHDKDHAPIEYNHSSSHAARLMLRINTNDLTSWGWAARPFQDAIGSFMIIRVDGKPLLREHGEALVMFCSEYLQPLIEHSMELGTAADRQIALDRMTKDNFLRFWEEYDLIQRNLARSTGWKTVPKPM